MFGQAMATFVPPMLGGTVVFMRGYNPHEIVRQVKKRRISVLVSVPKTARRAWRIMCRACIPACGSARAKRGVVERWWRYRAVHRLFGLKFWSFVVGAAPLESSLESFWSRLGFLVVQGYGLTETAPIVTLNHPFSTSKGSVGKAIAGVDIRIAPDGEILVRGENVTTGTTERPKRQAPRSKTDGSTPATSASSTRQARLFIRGRKKEMIVTPEGLNVFPEDVERVVNAVPRRQGFRSGRRHAERRRACAVALIVEPGIDAVGRREGGERAARRSSAHSRGARLARRRAAAHRRHEETEAP